MKFAALTVLLLLAEVSLACTRSPESAVRDDPVRAIEHADIIVAANVVSISSLGMCVTVAYIQIHELWKGRAASIPFLINDDCGCTGVQEGREYLLFARRSSPGVPNMPDGSLVIGAAIPLTQSQDIIPAIRQHFEGAAK